MALQRQAQDCNLHACNASQLTTQLLEHSSCMQMEPLYDDMRAAALEYAKAINVFAADLAAQVTAHPDSPSCHATARHMLWRMIFHA